MINELKFFLKNLFERLFLRNKPGEATSKESLTLELFTYDKIQIFSTTPDNNVIKPGQFIKIVYKNNPIWALFKCPCGCGFVISLSLQAIHSPHWSVIETDSGRPTVSPSIWQNKGCLSHFWITNG